MFSELVATAHAHSPPLLFCATFLSVAWRLSRLAATRHLLHCRHARCPSPLPVSVSYGASKRADELLAAAYHRIHGLRSTGCRFFTVYGPWGRPDMAM